MRGWQTTIAAAVAAVACIGFQAAQAQGADPASVLRRYVEALNAGDLEGALALWAEDGVLTNTRGRRYVGHENLRPFIRRNISRRIEQEPEAMQAVGDKLTWINRESNESYRRLEVAPVQQNSELIVRNGRIVSWINYFPPGEIAKIERACATPRGQGVLVNDQPCSQFVDEAKAQAARVLGAALPEKR